MPHRDDGFEGFREEPLRAPAYGPAGDSRQGPAGQNGASATICAIALVSFFA
jgi:hypothetical protein